MDIQCKRCAANIPAADVNISALMAKCGQCDAVFSIVGSVDEPKRERPPVEMPKSIAVMDKGHELVITRRWFHCVAIFLTFFAIVWNVFVTIFVVTGISQGEGEITLFAVPFVLVGVGLAYWTLCLYVNRTTIRVDSRYLQIKHGPLPWPGNAKIAADMVEQLWVKQRVTYSKNGGRQTSYELHANSKHGKSKKLLSNLYKPEEALYVEAEIERFLAIEDRAVSGEFDGRD